MNARRLILSLLLTAAACSAAAAQEGQNARLGRTLASNNPAEKQALQAVQQQLATQHFSAVQLFPPQSFTLVLGGLTVGSLVTGDAAPEGKTDQCFLAFVEPGRPVDILISTDQPRVRKDISACSEVRSAGIVPTYDPGRIRFAFFFIISLKAPHDFPGVVDAFSLTIYDFDPLTHQLKIDQAATATARAAHAHSVEEISNVLLA